MKLFQNKLLKQFKTIVKEEYMLNLFESETGSLDSLKKADRIFDEIFLGLQMRIIIWIVGVAVGILLYYYFIYISLSQWVGIPTILLLSYMLKRSLEFVCIALMIRKKNMVQVEKKIKKCTECQEFDMIEVSEDSCKDCRNTKRANNKALLEI